jgi:hypothetical protein
VDPRTPQKRSVAECSRAIFRDGFVAGSVAMEWVVEGTEARIDGLFHTRKGFVVSQLSSRQHVRESYMHD